MTDYKSEETLQYRFASHGTVPFTGVVRVDWTGRDGPMSRLVTSSVVVGSSPNADIVLEDANASRLHAQLELRDDGVWVRDLQSRNGTWLQGVRIDRALAPHLGTIRVGQTDLTILQVRLDSHDPDGELWPEGRFHGLLGGSRKMRALYATLARVASADSPVLIQGETGTGKEVVASAIHAASPRASGPLIVVDCAALPENLLDVELFGHARGAFTGSVGARVGAIEAANGGTVFLDEIGELPRSMQPKLLRVLEAKTIRRIGENEHRAVDVRFLFATHRDLLKLVSNGDFREDLFFRLSVLPVVVPPLREHLDDLNTLVSHFLNGKGEVSLALLGELRARAWTGNVRELRNFVDRMLALGSRQALAMSESGPASFAAPLSSSPQLAAAPASGDAFPVGAAPESWTQGADPSLLGSFRSFRDRWTEHGERLYVSELMERHKRNVPAASREAELDRTYLYKLIRKYGL